MRPDSSKIIAAKSSKMYLTNSFFDVNVLPSDPSFQCQGRNPGSPSPGRNPGSQCQGGRGLLPLQPGDLVDNGRPGSSGDPAPSMSQMDRDAPLSDETGSLPASPNPALSQTIIHARNVQDWGSRPWQDTTEMNIGMRAFGPVGGMLVLPEGWDDSAARFADALVRCAKLEKYTAFGESWGSSSKAWHSLKSSGITALSVTFYDMSDLDTFRNRVPATKRDSFTAPPLAQKKGREDLIFAVWDDNFVLAHGEGELEHCEYWVSLTHPSENHVFEIWPDWPKRVKGGQALTTCACAFKWNTKQHGPFFSSEKGRPNRGEGAYRLDRVPDDSQASLVKRAAAALY